MNRYDRLAMAEFALERAAGLAREAEQHARSNDSRHKAAPLAAAGSLWADIARTHTAIAAALPEPKLEAGRG
ncbi:hypothetical protein ACFW88_00280 [Streptomyces anandii]|uniref:Uncharacterized protein n=1 Tax=Streptomyces anandii TaxID=285454 RepID=A0ABW6GXK1_9ACTN